MKRIAAVVFVFALPALAAAASAPRAVVTFVSGNATASSGGVRTPLRLFDWLGSGTSIQVGPASRVVVALADGRRWELHDHAAVTVTDDGLAATSQQTVKQLASVPPLPQLPALVQKSEQRVAAVRVRGAKIENLYPIGDAITLADSTTLRFSPVAAASQYKVTVEDEAGDVVFSAETNETRVVISPGVLHPGARYYWQVRTVDRGLPAARGEAEFMTLAADQAKSRAAFRASLDRNETGALALAAEVDRSLGLLWEARETMAEALGKAPADTELRGALDRLETRLADASRP